MRGYVEAQEARHQFGYDALSYKERALLWMPQPTPQPEADNEEGDDA